eukprot:Opistho-2@88949
MARLSRACAALVLVVISAGLTVTHAAPFAADAIDVVSLSAMLESTGNGKPASLAATLTGHYDPCKSPIVLVPGLGGSVLDVMVTDEYEPPHSACRILFPKGNFTTGYNRLWPSLAAFGGLKRRLCGGGVVVVVVVVIYLKLHIIIFVCCAFFFCVNAT